MDSKHSNIFCKSNNKLSNFKESIYQNPCNILILSGGGFKGISSLGSLHYLYTTNKLNSIKYHVGTSVGSIISYLLIIGYTPEHILTHICLQDLVPDLNKTMLSSCIAKLTKIVSSTDKVQHLEEILSIILKQGIIKYEKIHNILHDMTISKLHFIPTMADLKYLFDKHLVCTTYRFNKNTKHGEIYYISDISDPDLSCLDAVRMSSNIPIIFGEHVKDGYSYIDGGLLDNFPIDAISKLYTLKNPVAIGITILGSNLLFETSTLMSIIGIIYLPIYDRELEKIKKTDNLQIIRLKVKEISHNCTTGEKLKFFTSGYNQTKVLFEKEKMD